MALTPVPGDDVATPAASQDHHTLTALVPRVAAATLLVLIAGTYITNNTITGDYNKAMYLVALAVAIALTALFVWTQRSTRIDVALAMLSAGGLMWGMWTIERPQLLLTDWSGFGYRVALATLALVVLAGTVLRSLRFSVPIRAVLWTIVAICCACDALGLIRTTDYMPAVNNNLNLVNDMLGPIAGKAPDSTFIPQYSALYGWLVLPFKYLLSPLALVGAIAIFITLLDVVTTALAIVIVRRILGRHGWLIATALIVPLTYVTSHLAGDQSSIASLSQEITVRVLSGLIVAAVGLHDLVLLYRGTVRVGRLVLIGAICGLVAWNSQDFGVAASGVFGLMVLVCATRAARVRAAGAWVGGLLIGLASYPLFLFAIGSPLNLGYVGAVVKLFGSGLGSKPMQVPGPALVVIPIIICSTAVGWALMSTRRRSGSDDDPIRDRAMMTLAFVGTWTAVCLVYYINRAVAAGQLQTMLLPCAVCIAALVSIVLHSDGLAALFRSDVSLRTRWADRARLIPTGIFACLCVASALLTPDPILAAKTLHTPPPMSGFTTYDLPSVLSAVTAAQRYTSGKPGELTYLGESFNYISLATHVPSSSVLFPFPLPPTPGITEIQCQHLASQHSQWMVLSINSVTAFGTNVCGLYRAVDVPGLLYGQLQEFK